MDKKDNVFVKLPLRLRDYTKKKGSNENEPNNGITKEECDECIKRANDMAVPVEKLCPDCTENAEPKENKQSYRLIKTHDYVRPEQIDDFFSTDKKTTTVIFFNGRIMTYRITEEEFKKKFEGLITIVE